MCPLRVLPLGTLLATAVLATTGDVTSQAGQGQRELRTVLARQSVTIASKRNNDLIDGM